MDTVGALTGAATAEGTIDSSDFFSSLCCCDGAWRQILSSTFGIPHLLTMIVWAGAGSEADFDVGLDCFSVLLFWVVAILVNVPSFSNVAAPKSISSSKLSSAHSGVARIGEQSYNDLTANDTGTRGCSVIFHPNRILRSRLVGNRLECISRSTMEACTLQSFPRVWFGL